MDGPARERLHPVEALGALKVKLGLVVVIENRGVQVAAHRKTAISQKLGRDRSGFILVDAETDGGFGEGAGEILEGHGKRYRRDDEHDADDAVLRGGQLDLHEHQGTGYRGQGTAYKYRLRFRGQVTGDSLQVQVTFSGDRFQGTGTWPTKS